MNTVEAKGILDDQLLKYRSKSYTDLVSLIENSESLEITAASGTWYQLKFFAAWDDNPNDVLRVFGSIDDGGLRAYFPLGDNFLVNPDGTFVGE